MTTYRGSCHCGRVAFEVDGELGTVMECNCSHCSRKGYLLWFVPRDSFRPGKPEAQTTSYKFNKHVIDHRFCPHCGCAPFALGKDRAGKETTGINVRCLEDVDLAKLDRKAVDGRNF